MKDFSPHEILRSPETTDEEVEYLLKLTSSNNGAPVALLIEPPGPWTRKAALTSQGSWQASAKRAARMSR